MKPLIKSNLKMLIIYSYFRMKRLVLEVLRLQITPLEVPLLQTDCAKVAEAKRDLVIHPKPLNRFTNFRKYL